MPVDVYDAVAGIIISRVVSSARHAALRSAAVDTHMIADITRDDAFGHYIGAYATPMLAFMPYKITREGARAAFSADGQAAACFERRYEIEVGYASRISPTPLYRRRCRRRRLSRGHGRDNR